MKRLLVLLGSVGIAFGIACKTDLNGQGNGCGSTGADYVITVDNGVAYSSRSLTVKPGSRVCWQNVGSTVHSVTSDPVVDSVVDDTTWHLDGQLNPELVVLYSQFNKLGADYRYHCRYHQASGMTGVIQVR